ncbi:hypothetical protein [Methylobacterium iners]|uniref:Uncharacterized protein n=1 Tax=Methylobacterium iners TaxID=418707 RepID=A0ABQ4S2W1_9HYPH|nr:hypothetical protein [Methylobacterium iners]GJD97475.1 hypothetical protein OCOJLMKI_4706 [Methylobacterium iners]
MQTFVPAASAAAAPAAGQVALAPVTGLQAETVQGGIAELAARPAFEGLPNSGLPPFAVIVPSNNFVSTPGPTDPLILSVRGRFDATVDVTLTLVGLDQISSLDALVEALNEGPLGGLEDGAPRPVVAQAFEGKLVVTARNAGQLLDLSASSDAVYQWVGFYRDAVVDEGYAELGLPYDVATPNVYDPARGMPLHLTLAQDRATLSELAARPTGGASDGAADRLDDLTTSVVSYDYNYFTGSISPNTSSAPDPYLVPIADYFPAIQDGMQLIATSVENPGHSSTYTYVAGMTFNDLRFSAAVVGGSVATNLEVATFPEGTVALRLVWGGINPVPGNADLTGDLAALFGLPATFGTLELSNEFVPAAKVSVDTQPLSGQGVYFYAKDLQHVLAQLLYRDGSSIYSGVYENYNNLLLSTTLQDLRERVAALEAYVQAHP